MHLLELQVLLYLELQIQFGIIQHYEICLKANNEEEFISLSSCQNSAMIKDREKLN